MPPACGTAGPDGRARCCRQICLQQRALLCGVVGSTARRMVPGLVTGLGLGLLALGPGLRRGFLLSYDMVFVPRMPFGAALPGLDPPRAVPSDLAIAAVSRLLPPHVAQKLSLRPILPP